MTREIVFDAGLYATEAVEAAAEAYRGHATVTVSPGPVGIVATLEGEPLDEELVHAFCNHALFETVVRRRRARAPEPA